MNNKSDLTKKRKITFIIGTLLFLSGLSIFGIYGYRKISRELYRQKLLSENIVIEIPDLNIEAPVLEGTDSDTLSVAVGHFINTGNLGHGNYCIAGHSSVIYDEYFNNLKNIKSGCNMNLYDKNKNCYVYVVTETFVVEPDATWILNDFGDNRITLVTCTDDGTQRQVVIGKLKENENQ